MIWSIAHVTELSFTWRLVIVSVTSERTVVTPSGVHWSFSGPVGMNDSRNIRTMKNWEIVRKTATQGGVVVSVTT